MKSILRLSTFHFYEVCVEFPKTLTLLCVLWFLKTFCIIDTLYCHSHYWLTRKVTTVTQTDQESTCLSDTVRWNGIISVCFHCLNLKQGKKSSALCFTQLAWFSRWVFMLNLKIFLVFGCEGNQLHECRKPAFPSVTEKVTRCRAVALKQNGWKLMACTG